MSTQQLLPFRNGTRQRIQRVGSKAWDAGNPVEFVLPRVGMASELIVQIEGTATSSAASVVKAKAPHSLAARYGVSANQGMASIIDVTGFAAHAIGRTRKFAQDYTGDTELHKAPVLGSATTDTARVTHRLPLSINDGTQFELGMMNLQAPELEVTLTVRCGSLADIGTNITSFVGTITVYYVYYEIPDPRHFAMPPLAVCRWLESHQSISATGEQIYTVPRQGVLYNLLQIVELDNALSDDWDFLALRFNKTDEPYRIEPFVQRALERDRYGLDHATGIVYWDFFNAFGAVNDGDARDVIDTEELSTTEFVLNVESGATLGSNNNVLRNVRRIVQVLQ